MKTYQELLYLAQTQKENIRIWYRLTDEKKKKIKISDMEMHQMWALCFLSTTNEKELCEILNISFGDLSRIINQPDYRVFYIPKKRGGKREINVPNFDLKILQSRLNYFLQTYYLSIKPKEVYGFIINPNDTQKYCNIVENAQNHIGKKYLLNIDLKDFFPNISGNRVRKLFESEYFCFSKSIATALSLLTIYEGKLPIGSPTSPVISNFICLDLDKELANFCKYNGLTYSRYADDLSFSSNAEISVEIIEKIKEIIVKNNFIVNTKKIHKKSNNQQQIVTGLVVNEKVNIKRDLLKRIRAMLHNLTRNGLYSATKNHFGFVDEENQYKFLNRLNGYINFVGQVRGKKDPIYLKFLDQYHKNISNY